ncbi:hypothetical protein B0H14DRAFT_25672 [Mycena olivaceomarginata]|nr:hypothetical protein B0H14DRAFT_25672 [Mycena olivaceomarginata]
MLDWASSARRVRVRVGSRAGGGGGSGTNSCEFFPLSCRGVDRHRLPSLHVRRASRVRVEIRAEVGTVRSLQIGLGEGARHEMKRVPRHRRLCILGSFTARLGVPRTPSVQDYHISSLCSEAGTTPVFSLATFWTASTQMRTDAIDFTYFAISTNDPSTVGATSPMLTISTPSRVKIRNRFGSESYTPRRPWPRRLPPWPSRLAQKVDQRSGLSVRAPQLTSQCTARSR